jgi:hypothetical protein
MKILGSRLLVLITLFALVWPGAVRAAGASEIPGVPLAASSVSRTVGGETVDLVYAVTLPAGAVLVASLRGAAGAELGLYLYDQVAESVLVDLPVAASAKPGASQGISAIIDAPGVYYLNVNGRNVDRAYAFTLSWSVTRDTTAPQVMSVSAPLTARASNTCLRVDARDPLSGVRSVRIADAGALEAAAWQIYRGAGNYCTAVTPGDGARTMTVQVRNGVGLLSSRVSRIVQIDDTAPQLRSTSPAQAGLLVASDQEIVWRFGERVLLGGGARGSVFAYSQAGAAIPGSATLSATGTSVRWRADATIPLGSVVLVSLTGVTDLAGNEAGILDTLQLARKRIVSVRVVDTRRRGDFARVSYQVPARLTGGELILEARLLGGWTEIGRSVIEGTSGSIRAAVGDATAIRLVWPGDDATVAASSGRVSLPR